MRKLAVLDLQFTYALDVQLQVFIMIKKSVYAHAFAFYLVSLASAWIQYPPDGFATMTHYTMPSDFVASCGCTSDSR